MLALPAMNDNQVRQVAARYVDQLTNVPLYSRVGIIAAINAMRAELNQMDSTPKVDQALDILAEVEMGVPPDII